MDALLEPTPGKDDFRHDLELIFRVYRDLVSAADERLRNCQLGRLHYQLLLFVRRRPNETVSHYLCLMRLTKQSMSRLVRELLGQGLVEERTGTRDRRERFLHLTEKGEALEQQLTEAQAARFARLHAEVGSEAVARFRDAMTLLIEQQAPRRRGPEAGREAVLP